MRVVWCVFVLPGRDESRWERGGRGRGPLSATGGGDGDDREGTREKGKGRGAGNCDDGDSDGGGVWGLGEDSERAAAGVAADAR